MSWTALGYRRNGVSETTNFNADAINAQLALKVNAEGSGTVADNALVRWDGVGGRDIQTSSATLSDAGVLTTASISTDTITEKTASAGITIADNMIVSDTTVGTAYNAGGALRVAGDVGITGLLRTGRYLDVRNTDMAQPTYATNDFRRGNGGNTAWISAQFGANAVSAGTNGDRVIIGNYNGELTIGGHNDGHTAWRPLYLGQNTAGASLNLRGIDINCTTTNGVSVSSTVESSSVGTGSMRLLGGLSVAKNIWTAGAIRTTSNATSTSTTTGSIIAGGGIGCAENINVAGIIKSTNATSSTLITNGAIVSIGGAGIGENINAGGVIKSTDTTQSSSISTGAIVSNGGIGCAKSLTVGEYAIASSAPTLGTHLCNKTYVDAKSAFTTGLTTATLNATHAGFITNPLIMQFRGYKIGTIAFVNIEIFATTASHISASGYIVNASAGHRFPAGFLPRTGTPTIPIMLDYDYYVSAGYTSKVQGCFVLGSDGDWTISMMEQQTAYTTVHADRDIGSGVGFIFKLPSCVLMYET